MHCTDAGLRTIGRRLQPGVCAFCRSVWRAAAAVPMRRTALYMYLLAHAPWSHPVGTHPLPSHPPPLAVVRGWRRWWKGSVRSSRFGLESIGRDQHHHRLRAYLVWIIALQPPRPGCTPPQGTALGRTCACVCMGCAAWRGAGVSWCRRWRPPPRGVASCAGRTVRKALGPTSVLTSSSACISPV